jgi:hypothetical protein
MVARGWRSFAGCAGRSAPRFSVGSNPVGSIAIPVASATRFQAGLAFRGGILGSLEADGFRDAAVIAIVAVPVLIIREYGWQPCHGACQSEN